MTTTEHDITAHYTHGSLERSIQAGLAALAGVDDRERIDQLAAVDEFHIGGREATAEIATQLELHADLHVLDIGCGIGGTARFFASRYGCRVTGVDLTPEYVEVGNRLNRLVGLTESIELRVGSALNLPFGRESFDRATMLHVGMNIADTRKLCAEAGRVLRPGAILALYDVMQMRDAPLAFPVPWAQTAATSFVHAPDEYRDALQAAGFEVSAERNRHEFAIAFFRRMTARRAEAGVPPLGLHIMMGRDAETKLANMIENVERGFIAPIEMIARRV
jgi:ubiquinone/menaquinone biosynthesis C-methylase UbiE